MVGQYASIKGNLHRHTGVKHTVITNGRWLTSTKNSRNRKMVRSVANIWVVATSASPCGEHARARKPKCSGTSPNAGAASRPYVQKLGCIGRLAVSDSARTDNDRRVRPTEMRQILLAHNVVGQWRVRRSANPVCLAGWRMYQGGTAPNGMRCGTFKCSKIQ